ncbi:MAG TPA: isochorismatase family protein [Burkholderiales bacterium]|nr:isochorismatase family protein [Pseudomonadota bacterium]HVC49202.1 isochorismatase family protein [Burkholderiales bacterium]
MDNLIPADGDALLVIDVQNDFLHGGSLAVSGAEEVVPVINHYLELFSQKELPIYVTRDWHPPDHCSFHAQGGIWPSHCVAGTYGAAFSERLELPAGIRIVSKARVRDRDAYSAFEETDLDQSLKHDGVKRLFAGGLATDYCVLNTLKDALALGYTGVLLEDAIRAVNVKPGDGVRALNEMRQLGVQFATITDLK